MQTHPFRTPLAFVLSLGATAMLAGCSGKGAVAPTTGNVDQSAVTVAVTAMPDMAADDLMDSPDNTAVSAQRARTGGLSVQAAITPRFFWRTIVSAVPRFTIMFSDSDSTGRPRQADVMVSRRLLGTFNVITATAGDPAVLDSANIVRKPLDDQWLRYLRLRRFVLPGEANVWRIVGATGVRVVSHNATRSIASVRVQTSSLDTTLTDPLQFFDPARCLHVAPGDSLRLTATTSANDDIVVAYWHDHRERFRNNGDGTYSITLHPGDLDGRHFFGVNALSNGTVNDDALPYDSVAWLFHCYMGPPPPEAYYQ